MPTVEEVVTSSWTPPDTVVGFSGTAVEPDSHIMLNWDASSLPAVDFAFYRLYRRTIGGEWEVLIDISNQSTMMHEDKTAGQTVQYQYMITQYQTVVGDVPLESDPSDIVSVALTTDAWFIVMLHNNLFHALELTVTTEEHSSVIQQEVFEPLASTRKRIVRGNILGDEGSLTFVFDQMDSKMAREHMGHIKMSTGPHILKSPFGDVWHVSFDAPAFKYLPAGHLEVTIGWVEVE